MGWRSTAFSYRSTAVEYAAELEKATTLVSLAPVVLGHRPRCIDDLREQLGVRDGDRYPLTIWDSF
jgi:hypothetical protein